jgi:hypothetical protein
MIFAAAVTHGLDQPTSAFLPTATKLLHCVEPPLWAHFRHPAECLQRAPQVYSSQREEVSATSANRDGAA